MAKEKSAGDYAKERANTEPDLASGRTSRDDPLDLGVPMKKGEGPAGPEDALGREKTRGDYSERIGPADYHPHQTEVDDDGNVVVRVQRTGEERKVADA